MLRKKQLTLCRETGNIFLLAKHGGQNSIAEQGFWRMYFFVRRVIWFSDKINASDVAVRGDFVFGGISVIKEWQKLYDYAKSTAVPRTVSGQICSGSVGAAVLTKSGNIYTGVCIDMNCSLGMCAERNALSTMLTAGEAGVIKVVSVAHDGRILPPCGACREFMTQLGASNEIEILVDENTAVLLKDLVPYPY